MKKTRLMLIFTIICFAFIPRVFATNYMSVNKNDVRVGEDLTVSVDIENIASWNLTITATENASACASEVTGSNPQGENVNHEKTCQITSPGTATLTLTGTITTVGNDDNPDGETLELNETLDITAAANEEPKGLASLTVNGGTLSPSFDSNQTNGYVLNLNTATTTNFSINAVAKTSSDTISAKRENGSDYEPIELNNISFVTAGNNSTMLIIITVGEGERAIQYEIQVVKPTYIGLPELSRLAIDGEQITLVSGVYTYEITLEEKDSYYVTATIKDTNNYMFNEFLVPPVEISSKEFELDIVPKDATAGLRSAMYHITIKTNEIEPVTNPTTTKKPSSSSSGGNGSIENPQTGTSAYVVGIILVSSLALSMYLYKKNINGYN